MPTIKRLGILGGTFNPPHNGHVFAARAAKDALSLDHVLFIPAKDPPHKALPEESASAGDRLFLTRLAAQSLPFASVSDLELRRDGKSYTVDTLEALRPAYPGAVFWLICGSDMFFTLSGWRRAADIFSLARIAAVSRMDSDHKSDFLRYASMLSGAYGAKVDIIDNPALELSSTEVRALLARGEGFACLPPAVGRYIKEKGLYRRPGGL